MDVRSPTPRPLAAAALTLLAPIRRGAIDGADGPSYLARLEHLLRALASVAGLAGADSALIDAGAVPADAAQPGHTLDLTIFEPEYKLRLELALDQPLRTWLPALPGELGALLDLILCNCKGYSTAPGPTQEANAQWLHAAQAEAQFFSHTVPAPIDSEPVRRELERLRLDDPAQPTGLVHLRLRLPRRDVDARRAVESHPHETVKAGLQMLEVLHRLAELYPTDAADGAVLLRAAHELLRDLRKEAIRPLYAPGTEAYRRFAASIRWFDAPSLPA